MVNPAEGNQGYAFGAGTTLRALEALSAILALSTDFARLPIFSYLFRKFPPMRIDPFKLERYFARYEFTAPYLLSSSDCEPLDLNELLSMIHGETMKMWNILKLGYTESQGHPELRSEITQLYQSLQPEQVMVCVPEEGIFIAMNNLLQEKDEVITTFPAYQSLYEV